MRRKAVGSTSLRSVGYDPRSRILEVEFRNGSVYQYAEVSAERHRRLLRAESLGAYFNRHIRDHYPTFQVA